MSIKSDLLKDCNECHGKGVVRARFVDHPNGKVRAILCPDCGGVGSWVSKRARL